MKSQEFSPFSKLIKFRQIRREEDDVSFENATRWDGN